VAAALAARGAELILLPRATPAASYERWKTVIRSTAITCAVFVASVNRPAGEPGVDIGGPSLLVAPDGAVVLETSEPVALAELESDAISRARQSYPGYLDLRPRLYAEAWRQAADPEE
jgi:predicted amidohydrolase